MNGGAGEIIGDFPFMLRLVEAFIGFFSRITILKLFPKPRSLANAGRSNRSSRSKPYGGSRFKELTKFQPFKQFKSFKSSIAFKVHRDRIVPVVPIVQTVERVQSLFKSVFPQASRKAWAISKFALGSLTV